MSTMLNKKTKPMEKPIKVNMRVWHSRLGKGIVVDLPLQHSSIADVKWDATETSNLVAKQNLYPL